MTAPPGGELLGRLAAGLAVNVALAAAGVALRALTRGGAAVGAALGAVVWVCGGARAFLLLAAFVGLGTLATRLGWERKAAAGIAELGGGRRGVASALAKVVVPTLAALAAANASNPLPYWVAFAGALATAAGDTVSSEIGKAFGRRTWLITTLAPAPPGSDGAVSAEGSLAGLAAILAVAGLGVVAGLYPVPGALAVASAAVLANVLESVAGATLEHRGRLGHEAVNFSASLAGALLSAVLARLS